MLIRMFEYGAQIALDDGKVMRSPAGKLDYEIAVVKLHSYSLEEISNKKLLFLIPFYIFTHENRFKVYDEDKEQRKIDYTGRSSQETSD